MRLRSLLLVLAVACTTAPQRPAAVASPAAAPSKGTASQGARSNGASGGAAAPVLEPAAIGPYPAAETAEGKADLAILLWLQRTRTAEDVARSKDHATITLDSFAPALPPGFRAASFPATRALLERAEAYGRAAVGASKDHYRRPRPYDVDARVKPAIKLEPSSSYPSGHSTRGLLLARVLAELVPDRREAILRVGLQIGYDRVVGGVHYPSDVLAGEVIANAVADRLLADEEFRRQLDETRRAEWSAPRAAVAR